MPMASTTKIMTCLLALEYMEENEELVSSVPVTASKRAAQSPKVHLGMQEGDQYMLGDILYSLMLESHNDTAVAVAEYIDGSVEQFAARMNRRAQELGCTQTTFITPNGLDAEEDGKIHSTTAYELALIAAEALKNERFCEIIQTSSYSFQEIGSGRSYTVNNKDAFLTMMDGAIGVKTGFTGNAGYCFVGALERDGKRLISVVLACGWPPNKTWKWHDTKQLMTYGLENFTYRDIDREFTYEPVKVENGVSDSAAVYVEKQETEELGLLLSDEDEVSVEQNYEKTLEAPVYAGTVIGEERYFVNGELYKSYQIKTAESVELYTYFYCLKEIFMLYFLPM
jgi:D-alanyl-D-alanine carboxypeptidase (penicillin-binding protein 5/6)